ncbi:MAG: hypothetical protein WC637_18580 [Victivallales bacterium]|jgi:hypothetical protein
MNDQTLLLRQIHPSWIQNGQPSSLAFNPSKKDDNLLSVYDGDCITAEDAYLHYTTTLRLGSACVFGLAVCECTSEGLFAKKDPLPDSAYHAVIDFSSCTSESIKDRTAKALKSKAIARGCLFQS